VTVAPEEIIAAVGSGLPPEVACEADHRGVMLRVPPGHWLAALAFARDRLDCDFFDWLTAVDEADEGFSVVVHVYSLAGRHHVLVATPLPRSSPRLPTATGIYRGAAWHERETHEMFGIGFDGHPHLAPLLQLLEHLPSQASGCSGGTKDVEVPHTDSEPEHRTWAKRTAAGNPTATVSGP